MRINCMYKTAYRQTWIKYATTYKCIATATVCTSQKTKSRSDRRRICTLIQPMNLQTRLDYCHIITKHFIHRKWGFVILTRQKNVPRESILQLPYQFPKVNSSLVVKNVWWIFYNNNILVFVFKHISILKKTWSKINSVVFQPCC